MLLTAVALSNLILMNSGSIDQVCKDSVQATITQFPDEKFAPADLAVSVNILDRPNMTWQSGNYGSEIAYYPASVVKLFWLAFLAHQVEIGKVKMTEEDQRAARDMIVDSNNDATGAIVNLSTGALPGPELKGKEYDAWLAKRMQANRWYESLGYKGINVLNRTYNEGPYGREAQAIGRPAKNRNSLTANATCRLMSEIALGKIVGKDKCNWMLGLLKREIPVDNPKADDQSINFIGGILASKTVLHSKAGWTSDANHDVAYLKMPDGREVVIAVFTIKPNNEKILQALAKNVLSNLGYPVRG